MARFTVNVESSGKPVKGAQVWLYEEDQGIAAGNEDSGFTEDRLAEIFSDPQLQTPASQPLETDDQGQATAYVPSGTQLAVKVARSMYGTAWERFVDVTGSDL